MKRVILASLAGLVVLAAALIAAGVMRGPGDTDTAAADGCLTSCDCGEDSCCYGAQPPAGEGYCDACGEIPWCADSSECGLFEECVFCECQESGNQCSSPGQCDNGLFCDGEELCLMGWCVSGFDPCDDQNDCTTDTCDENTDTCGHTNVPNGMPCDPEGYVCQNGECVLAGPPMPAEVMRKDLRVRATLECAPFAPEEVELSGDILTRRDFDTLADTDANDLEQIETEIIELNLTGESELVGTLTARLRDVLDPPYQRSEGEIEEQANLEWERLDVLPFAEGTADSFFDIFFELEADPMVVHNTTPLRVTAEIDDLDGLGMYEGGGGVIDLVDEEGSPICQVSGLSAAAAPPVSQENTYDLSVDAHLECEGVLEGSEDVTLDGYIVTFRDDDSLADKEPNNREQVETEIIELNLTGTSSILGSIDVVLREDTKHPFQKSEGEIEEKVNNTPLILDIPPFTDTGSADSFFDVFFELQANPLTVHNGTPLRITAELSQLLGSSLYQGEAGAIDLLDENNQPIGCQVSNLSAAAAPAVGGMVELFVDPAQSPASATGDSSSSVPLYAAIAGAAAAAVVVLAAGGWYARRRLS